MEIISINDTNDMLDIINKNKEYCGFKSAPSKEDIIFNDYGFETIKNDFPFINLIMVQTKIGRDIIRRSTYPEYLEEYLKYIKNVFNKFDNFDYEDFRNFNLYDFVVKGHAHLFDYKRFMLASYEQFKYNREAFYEGLKNINGARNFVNKELDEFSKRTTNFFDEKRNQEHIIFVPDVDSNGSPIIKVIDYDELRGRKQITNNLKIKKEQYESILRIINPQDVRVFTRYEDLGDVLNNIILFDLSNVEDPIKQNEIICREEQRLLSYPQMAPYIDWDKFYSIAYIRLTNFALYAIHDNTFDKFDENESIDVFDVLETINDVYKIISKFDKDKVISYFDKASQGVTQKNTTIDEIIKSHDEVIALILNEFIGVEPDNAYMLLDKNYFNLHYMKDNILNSSIKDLGKYFEKAFFRYKKISPEEFTDVIFSIPDEDIDRDKIFDKVLTHKNEHMKYFFENGFISTKDIKRLFENGALNINDVLSIKNKIDGLDTSDIELNASAFANSFKIINQELILKIFKHKEGYSDEEIQNLIASDSALNETNPDYIKRIRADYNFQMALWKKLDACNNEKYVQEFLDALGEEIQLSPRVIIELYKRGIISGEIAKEFDSDFAKFYSCYRIKCFEKSTLRFNSYDIVVNLIKHNKLKEEDILYYYSIGEISEDIYTKLKDSKFKLSASITRISSLLEKVKNNMSPKSIEELNKYYKECKNIGVDESFFNEFDNLIMSNKKIDNKKLLKLAENQILSKYVLENELSKGNYQLIASLLKGENKINIETARYLFCDIYKDNVICHDKRDVLEKIFKTTDFSNDEKFSILLATYRGSDLSAEQSELNNDNLQYFFNKGYISLNYFEEKVSRGSKGIKRNESEFTGSSDKQRRFPLFERFDKLFSLDVDTVANKKGPAIVFYTPRKTIIETLGTLKDNVLQNDLTNHRTFIIDTNEYELNKHIFTTITQEGEIIQYNKLISWFDDNKEFFNMRAFSHTKYWARNIQEYIENGVDREEKVCSLIEEKNKKRSKLEEARKLEKSYEALLSEKIQEEEEL